MYELLRDFPNVLNIVALIIGWLIINYQNNQRETRKEVRASLNDIQSIIAELEVDGVRYHTEKRDKKAEILISSKANLLSKKIQYSLKSLDKNYVELINKYRQILTDESNFGSQHKPLDDDAHLVLTIHNQAQILSVQLEKDFVYCYHRKWLKKD